MRRSPTPAPTASTAWSTTARGRGWASSPAARPTWTCARRSTTSASTTAYAAEIGLRLFKVGMPWPLEADSVRQFAEGLEEILVVEEKRQIIEYQLKEMLYNWREDVRPRVVGKYDETGEWPVPEHRWLLPPTAELTPAIVARAIAARIGRFHTSPRIADYIAFLDAKTKATPCASPR
jgi:TPP-dependent indolepyruvate ferredoxin oxidoreductase alpha subunit